jgi:hypothetical protein
MSIVNRRNALVGWATMKVGKRVARRKIRGAASALTSRGGRSRRRLRLR